MRALIFVSVVFLYTTAYADVTQQAGKVLIQNVASPELYVFCNQTSATIILDRVAFDNPGVQAGWSSSMPAHECSVFLTDTSPFVFACSQEASGALTTIDCQKVLLASRLPWGGQMLGNQSSAGSYWILENITSDEVLIGLRHKNIDT